MSDDGRLISWALRSYAEQLEAFSKKMTEQKIPWPTNARDIKRARELADQYYPYDWASTVIRTTTDSTGLRR